MKKIALLASLLVASNAFAFELPNYKHVKGAVSHGVPVRIAIDFTKCSAAASKLNHPMFSVGVFSPNEMIITKDGTIAASMNHFTVNDKNVPAKPVYQFVTYHITSDENVTLSAQILDAVNFAPLTKKHTYVCKLTEGAHVYSQS